MPRRAIGIGPMTAAERQAKQRLRAKEQRSVARDAIEFLRFLPDDRLTIPQARALNAIKRRIRIVFPEINPNAALN